MKYRVTWLQTTTCWATVEANSKKEAIARAKRGEYDDPDTEPGHNIAGSYSAKEE